MYKVLSKLITFLVLRINSLFTQQNYQDKHHSRKYYIRPKSIQFRIHTKNIITYYAHHIYTLYIYILYTDGMKTYIENLNIIRD